MHGRGSARTKRVCNDVFWGEPKSGRAHSLPPRPHDRDDVGGADRAETLRGTVVAVCGGWITSMSLQAKEDVMARSNWAG